MQINKGLKVFCLITFLAVIIAITIFIATGLSIKNNSGNDNNDNSPSQTPATIICDDEISVELLGCKKLEYTVTGNQTYSVTISVADELVATIDDEYYIHPNQIGTTSILISVNSMPKVTKNVTLKVIDCVSTVDFLITDTLGVTPQNYYTNTQYLLHISQNTKPLNTPQILCSMSEFSLISKNDTEYIFGFYLSDVGDFSFSYVGDYVNLTKHYNCLELPQSIDVAFNNVEITNNKINLYLFDSTCIELANEDGVYNQTSFNIIKLNTNDVINVSITGDCVNVSENVILAKSVGTAYLNFEQIITSNYRLFKTIQISVNEIDLAGLMIDEEQLVVGYSCTKEIDSLENIDFAFSKYPAYALYDLIIDFDDCVTKYENGKLFVSGLAGFVYLKYKNEIVYTMQIVLKEAPQPDEITYLLSIDQNYLLNCNATVESDNRTISVNLTNGDVIHIFSVLVETFTNGTKNSVQNFEASFEDESICCHSGDHFMLDGVLNVEVLKTGTCIVTICDIETGNNFEITINIV